MILKLKLIMDQDVWKSIMNDKIQDLYLMILKLKLIIDQVFGNL